ncbi:MAG: 2-oxoglutarate and iron-dependent oxygenase domain-containing protein [Steroidobacteraceae bacterium]
MTRTLPELSLTDFSEGGNEARRAFSEQLMLSLQRYGFFTLRNHLVTATLLEQAYRQCATLFAQPLASKLEYARGVRGYVPFGTEHAKDGSPADLKEFWQMGPEADPGSAGSGHYSHLAPANAWPEEFHGFKQTFTLLFAALQDTGRKILEALTAPLGLQPGFFDSFLRERNSVLRLIHYPAVGTGAAAGAARSAAHEDINLITLLPAPRGPGLELRDPEGRWLTIETDPQNLIVDSGDMLARITNDRIPSTTHRVVNPADAGASRYSMPFFMHPDPGVTLSCLPSCVGGGARYPDILSGVFLEQRLREIGLIPEERS